MNAPTHPSTAGLRVPWSPRPWRRVMVYGLGVSGKAAARLLLARGVAVVAVDERPRDALGLGSLAAAEGLEIHTWPAPQELPEGLDGVVTSPGVPLGRPLLAAAREAGLPVIAEVELAFPLLGETAILAVTGTNGKSTTTALAGAMVRAAGFETEVCGNIGEPITARVDGAPGRVFAVELSSFQLEAVDTFRPRAAALLNLAPDHLDRYPSFEAYAAAKGAIFRRQRMGDVAVFNADDARVAALVRSLGAGASAGDGAPGPRWRSFSRTGPVEDGCYLEGETVVEAAPAEAPRALFTRRDVPLEGAHNLENAMAAALLARAVAAEAEDLERGLRGFAGLPHRMQRVAEIAGVRFVDDSKGTNVAATVRSLEDLPDGAVHLILGGKGKGEDLRTLAGPVGEKARRAYLIGETAQELEGALGELVPCERSGTLERAVAAAAERARPGEVVLLSPACASFDQFTSFAARGERFRQLVEDLEEGARG